MTRILLLGGTTEAGAMARALAEAGLDAVYSYAGRTRKPVAQPLPMRIGGFGGPDGLVDYLRAERITHVIDATHPFAAGMSRNAVAACTATGTPLIVLERPPWAAQPGDRWLHVPDYAAAAKALPGDGSAVFLAIGRQNLQPFVGLNHVWMLRFAEVAAHPLRDATLIVSRGPFTVAGDMALMRRHAIAHVVAKNAGGQAAQAKLAAARALGLPVVMIDRPALPLRRVVATPAEVMAWLHGADRGV
ncbi:cobalt-precorrin-6A reductase [Paracoccus sp. PS-1]|uniref:cobalt-precorrin-6A reductase n=1 Tax=unclassified Paracoccus (in: a-proteobacteria) TaxID=2688777 RepID=UPI00049078F6|nr:MULTISPECIES: cobalt-precorrin-6A reductase [unclassified Paracoccus (in: a-proteobacteria)]MDQ7260250.1 cobalt-precorrin-6A reductase [Paracoccus sp. PS1]